MEGLGLFPGEYLEDAYIPSGFYCFYVVMVQRRKKCCTPTTEDSYHVLCVFTMLASTGVLAEGIC